MFDAAAIVPRPATNRSIPELGMRGSGKEIPDQPEQWVQHQKREHKPEGWWLTSGCYLEGSALPINDNDELEGPPQHVEITGSTAALCIAHGRLFVIVRPNDETEPAVWIAATVSDINVETEGSQGFRGRPKELTLTADHWNIKVVLVHRLYRRWDKKRMTESGHLEERIQRGQEGSLLKELTKAAQVKPRQDLEAAPNQP